MRRITFPPSTRKVANAERHIAKFAAFTKKFEGWHPEPDNEGRGSKFWNLKIPVLDRLVNPPTTNPILQKACIQHLIDIAAMISVAKNASGAPSIVTALITMPTLFDSEVCVFFDRSYLAKFTTEGIRNDQTLIALPKSRSLLKEMGLRSPPQYGELGFQWIYEDEEDESGPPTKNVLERWVIGEI